MAETYLTQIGESFKRFKPRRTRNGELVAWGTFLCHCGKVFECPMREATSGRRKSCGCLSSRLFLKARATTHGQSKTAIYRSWYGMMKRCYNSKSKRFSSYGGRGITVCERWRHSFENFFSDVGPKPSPKHSLDRIDVNGNYEPGNCRWATSKEQMRNTRRNRMITAGAVTKTMVEWSSSSGIKTGTIWNRLNSGWSDADAVSIQVGNIRTK